MCYRMDASSKGLGQIMEPAHMDPAPAWIKKVGPGLITTYVAVDLRHC